MRIPYKVYHLMYVTKLSCKCRKKEKKEEKEKEETNIRKTNKCEKKRNKRKCIIYTITYLPGNGVKNLTRPKS